MPVTQTVSLEFDATKLLIASEKDIRNQLSAVAADGAHLWLGCDEGCRLERLSRSGADRFDAHEVFELDALLDLPADPTKEEVDIEGLYVDDGWLWLVGSHSMKRKKPDDDDSLEKVEAKLLKTPREGNRHLLGRIPIANGKPRKTEGSRVAATLAANTVTSDLLDAVRADAHLKAFVDVPGKDNGFDIEGLAVRGLRVWVGLRGPVLREWCCILELQLRQHGDTLSLVTGPDGPFRKHFLNLDGLGIRDLALLDDDLVILAGPTMAHDGPSGVWRWEGAAAANAKANRDKIRRVLALPQGERMDKPEGLAVVDTASGGASVLVVFDTPASTRKIPPSSVKADVYRLP